MTKSCNHEVEGPSVDAFVSANKGRDMLDKHLTSDFMKDLIF